MPERAQRPQPPDQAERRRALDPARSVLVQAPAGSGKTDLLTRRFLRLLARVDDPGQILAITFTKAAAAEMRHRILGELEKAAAHPDAEAAPGAAGEVDELSMEALAAAALARSEALGWRLVDLPAQLRITTIDAFCRELAVEQPMLTGLGGGLDIADPADELYRRAARAALSRIGSAQDPALSQAIEELLLWRDNNWQDLEQQLVEMLASRDRWMQEFVFDREIDWDGLRARLERPFATAVRAGLTTLSALLDQEPGARDEALALARFACNQPNGEQHRALAELVEIPSAPFVGEDELEDARQAFEVLAGLLLTKNGGFRQRIDKNHGFPAERKQEKARLTNLIGSLSAVDGLEAALIALRDLPPARYTEDDWRIVRACFTLLRHAAGQLRTVFAEAGAVDYAEIAQIALRVLRGEDGLATDAALRIGDEIRHILVDEFQDTSR
ncbi:MAG: UvrD-helicase domain-containing protein, partial [Terracidiphilus sp.]